MSSARAANSPSSHNVGEWTHRTRWVSLRSTPSYASPLAEGVKPSPLPRRDLDQLVELRLGQWRGDELEGDRFLDEAVEAVDLVGVREVLGEELVAHASRHRFRHADEFRIVLHDLR